MRRSMLMLLLVSSCSSGSEGEADSSVPVVGSDSSVPVVGSDSSVPVVGSDSSVSVVGNDAGTTTFGDPHTGNFWIGPVDYEETEFHNACGPSDGKYPALIQQLYGDYLMGLANEAKLENLTAGKGQLCDVCAELTANGKTLIAHVVTYGEETGPNDIDVSPAADKALQGSTSRTLTWRFVTCPTANPIYYTFDGREWSNTWFFRVWVRNARVPVTKVEFKLGTKAWATATWQSDGAWQAASQDFGAGFSLRVTSINGQTVEDTIPGIGSFDPDKGIASQTNFQ
jgi:hypothetical protein